MKMDVKYNGLRTAAIRRKIRSRIFVRGFSRRITERMAYFPQGKMKITTVFLRWISILVASGSCLLLYAVDKSGVAPNTVSLPSGPGSMEGLGEAFQPTLNTGTAKYEVPLHVPPGTNGHAPKLALQYESGSGNGCLGFGWKLPLAFIQRQTDKGIPRYVDGPNQKDDDFDSDIDESDEVDGFINDAKEELVPVKNGEFIDYFSKNEGAFIRYRRIDDHWEGTLPTGTRWVFGQSMGARIIDSANPTKTFRWLLEKEIDTNGNTIVYHYSEFPGEQNRNQKYCSKIEYGPGTAPWENFHFITFNYEDRPDWFEDARSGFIIRTGKRVKDIVIGTQGPLLPGHIHNSDLSGDGVNDNLNRIYRLEYHQDHWSKLKSVTPVGADGVGTLPPSLFDYTLCKNDTSISAENHIIRSINEPLQVFDSDLVDFLDLNGDGLPDLLKTGEGAGSVHQCYVNQGQVDTDTGPAIKWSDAVEVDVPENDFRAWNVSLASDKVALADMTGDGLSDLCQATADSMVYFANKPKSESGKISWGQTTSVTTQDVAPPTPFESAVRQADINFDKRIDVIKSIGSGNSVSYQVWFLLAEQTYSNRVTVTPPVGLSLSAPGVAIADINGDRVPDIAQVRPTGITVIAGLGHGHFSNETFIAIPDLSFDINQVQKAKLRDITGDGMADLVLPQAAPGELWFWVNLGNYTLGERRMITHLPISFGDDLEIRWADLNGNGTMDLIYGASETETKIQSIDIGELLGCAPRPHMLNHINNGIGRMTKIEYATSTTFMLDDGTDDTGEYRYNWPDPLPFAVDVVRKVTTLDSLGNSYITQFKYHDGYYDADEKQFRGFARVEQIDIGDDSAPSQVLRHIFDTGKDIDMMKGKLLRQSTEVADEDDMPFPQDDISIQETFSTNETQWTTRKLHTGVDGREVNYAFSHRVTTTIYERGHTPVIMEIDYDMDNVGNTIVENNKGIISGPDWTADLDDERFISREFAINLEKWIMRRPSIETIGDENGPILSRKETIYDNLALGQVETGNVTLVREWHDAENDRGFINSMRNQYDDFGNPIIILDPLALASDDGVPDPNVGHFREIQYDHRFHSYPVREIIHVGDGSEPLIIQAEYDEGFATVTKSIDFNGFETAYGYDEFGRFTTLVKPGDTAEMPTIEYDYILAETFGENGIINYVETRQLDKSLSEEGSAAGAASYFISRQFTDGLGRTLMTKEEAEPDPNNGNPRVVVKGAVTFNARQKTESTLQPYYTTVLGDLEDLLEFEDITAEGWQGQFHENGTLVSLGLETAHQTTMKYDVTLRELQVTNPDGTFRRVLYEPWINRSFDENDTDPNSPHFNTPFAHYHDGLARLVRVDETVKLTDDGSPSEAENTWITTYAYDVNDRLVRITDSQNNVKTMVYDGLKRKTSMNDPDRGIMHYEYDEASNLMRTVDAKEQVITYTYDGVNRLTSEDYHDAHGLTPDVTYHYDEPTAPIPLALSTTESAKNTKGLLSYVTDLSGEEHTSYDERGRVEWVIKRIPDFETGQMVSYKIENEYDSLDRVTGIIYPDNDRMTFRYNDRKLLESIPSGMIENIDYIPSGQRLLYEYGNNVNTDYTYDSRSRLNSLITVKNTSPDHPLLSYAYTFDGVSNITQITDLRPGSQRPQGSRRRNTQVFAYDNLYRLTKVRYSLTLSGDAHRDDGSIHYRYDRIGNMLSKISNIEHHENGHSVTNLGSMGYGQENNVGGDVPVSDSFGRFNRIGRQPGDAPGPHALTSTDNGEETRNITYDDNGNMIALEGAALVWDFKDRLVRYEKGDTLAEYTYDYTNRRITKKVFSKDEGINSMPRATRPSNREPRSTIYVDRLFEIRDQGQPTKYAFDGSTRCARFTKMLDTTTEKTQWVRLRAGWNFISFYVQPNSLSFAETFLLHDNEDAIWMFDNDESGFVQVMANELMSAGQAYMIYTHTPMVIAISGIYTPPDQIQLHGSLNALSWPLSRGLSPQHDLTNNLDHFEALQTYDSVGAKWQGLFPGHPQIVSDFPETLIPAQAILASLKNDIHLQINTQTSLDIRFYHGDHLGSASVVTDGDGNLVEATVFYPFGHQRHRYIAPKESPIADYGFAGKEQDRESGLKYFDARYLSSFMGKFASVDPLALVGVESRISNPQKLNPYAYGLNNPLTYIDPNGLAEWNVVKDGLKEAGLGMLGIAVSSAAIGGGAALTGTGAGAVVGAFAIAGGAVAFSGAITQTGLALTKIFVGLTTDGAEANKLAANLSAGSSAISDLTDPKGLAVEHGVRLGAEALGASKKDAEAFGKLSRSVAGGIGGAKGFMDAQSGLQKVSNAITVVKSVNESIETIKNHGHENATSEVSFKGTEFYQNGSNITHSHDLDTGETSYE